MTTSINQSFHSIFNTTWPPDNCSKLVPITQLTVGDEIQLNFTLVLKPVSNFTIAIFSNGSISQKNTFMTPSAKSSAVQAVTLTSKVGAYYLRVQWDPPLKPNGEILAYDIRVNNPSGHCVDQGRFWCVDCSPGVIGSRDSPIFLDTCSNSFNTSFNKVDKILSYTKNYSQIRAYIAYTIQVAPLNSYGWGHWSSTNTATGQYVPMMVSEFVCKNATVNSFNCFWRYPGIVNDPAMFYKMECHANSSIYNDTFSLSSSQSVLVTIDVMANENYTCTIRLCTTWACSQISEAAVQTPPLELNVTSMASVMSTSTKESTSSQVYVVLPYSLVTDRMGRVDNFTLVVVVHNKGVIQNSSNDTLEKTYPECDKGYKCPYTIRLPYPSIASRRRRDTSSGIGKWQDMKFALGNEPDCRIGSCNGILSSDTQYSIGWRVCLSTGCVVVVTTRTTTKDMLTVIIIVVTVLLLMLVILTTMALVFYCRRRNRRCSERNKLISKEDSGGSQVDNFDEYYNCVMKDSCGLASEQFSEIIGKWKELEDQKKLRYVDGNEMKNRYSNIKPYVHNVIEFRGDGDYINASRICSRHWSINTADQCHCTNYYIATQGPINNSLEGKPSTVGDFWRMCFEHDVRIIINLTKCVESYKEKCSQYWPEGNNMQGAHVSGKHTIHVTLDKALPNKTFEERTFTMTMNGQEKSIRQLHFVAWPDHDCPEIDDFLEYYARFIKCRSEEDTVLIHCSAGVGRTGTFILIDIELRKVDKESSRIEIYNTLMKLRRGRCLMVQTEKQFVFAYDVIHTYLKRKGLLGARAKVLDQGHLDSKNSYLNPSFE